MIGSMGRVVWCVWALAVVCSGCGESAPGSPVAPSGAVTPTVSVDTAVAPSSTPAPAPPVTPPAASSTGASIVGSVSTDSTNALAGYLALSTGLIVRIVGTQIEATCSASGNFELKDVPEGNVELQFSGPGIDAKISIEGITAREHIEITVKVTGSSAAIEKTNRQTPDSKVDLSGTIASVDTGASSFRLSDLVVMVTSGTTLRRGSQTVPFSDFRTGDEVRVRGLRDGSIVQAEKVEAPAYRTISGIVSGLAGSCPNVTFALDGVSVSTDASTTYTGSSCADVKNNEKRSVSGLKTEGPFMARFVSGGEAVERYLQGYVGSLAGSCPSLTFTVSSTGTTTGATTGMAATNGSTTFSPGLCSDIKNGVKVSIKGVVGADGRVLASYVEVAKTASSTRTLKGYVAGLTGSCPGLTFAVNSSAITTTTLGKAVTNGSTKFSPSPATCSDLKNGFGVTVEGTVIEGVTTSEGKVLASVVTITSTSSK